MKAEGENFMNDRLPKHHLKARSRTIIEEAVALAAAVRKVDALVVMGVPRGCNQVSSARVLAMGLAAACGVPNCHLVRCFNRKAPSVVKNQQRCGRLIQNSAKFREEWEIVFARLKGALLLKGIEVKTGV